MELKEWMMVIKLKIGLLHKLGIIKRLEHVSEVCTSRVDEYLTLCSFPLVVDAGLFSLNSVKLVINCTISAVLR